ncbi:MAG: PQQ-binding-like beta-propeller repeat protein [Planctomycetaceae bacterium]|nr:PQQ-binding-like beta-propeller repeat protein [Planctomycetaceae bacterium]
MNCPRIANYPLAALWLGSLLAGQLASAADWTRFQDLKATAAGVALPTTDWSPTENQLWSTEIHGYGQSSPVTWHGRVFVTSISGPNKEHCHISSYDLKNGEKQWQVDVDSATQAENTNYISRGAPTPVVDAEGLYCFFEGGNLLSLTHDGKPRWERNLVEEFGKIGARHGLSASLEQNDDQLFVWVERESDPYVLSVDKATGKDVWKVPGVGATSWASPRLLPVDGGQHLILSAVGSITGLDPATGQTLWKLEGISGNSSPTPVPAGPNRFLIGATVGRGESDNGKAADSNGLARVQKNDDGTYQAEYVWRAKRATSSFGSPMAYQGMAYFVNATGVLYGLDLETGEERFSQRLADSMWATPIPVGDRILFCGKGGTVSVIASGPEFSKIAENATWPVEATEAPAEPQGRGRGGFGGPVLYAGALADNRLLFRRGDRLYCVGQAGE